MERVLWVVVAYIALTCVGLCSVFKGVRLLVGLRVFRLRSGLGERQGFVEFVKDIFSVMRVGLGWFGLRGLV